MIDMIKATVTVPNSCLQNGRITDRVAFVKEMNGWISGDMHAKSVIEVKSAPDVICKAGYPMLLVYEISGYASNPTEDQLCYASKENKCWIDYAYQMLRIMNGQRLWIRHVYSPDGRTVHEEINTPEHMKPFEEIFSENQAEVAIRLAAVEGV